MLGVGREEVERRDVQLELARLCELAEAGAQAHLEGGEEGRGGKERRRVREEEKDRRKEEEERRRGGGEEVARLTRLSLATLLASFMIRSLT